MIKEYFTDGLIGLAILLSLFRTDLVGINNLINYPEVQDIILGQTAAYMPANFHHIHNSPHGFGNSKYLDYDNDAFSAWYQNINSLPVFRGRRELEIQAYLVNSQHENTGEQFQSEYTTNVFLESNSIPEITLSTLPEESANSFIEEILDSLVSQRPDTNIIDGPGVDQPSTVDVSQLSNNPFPGCNLTKEDLNLIDILYQQDVDLGVGKEVFDPSMREELDRERELEYIKQQERQKAKILAEEKKEREKQELKDRWLKKNFRRDGETGEWVQLQDGVAENFNNFASPPFLDPSENDESITLEDALDFLGNLQKDQDGIAAEVYHDNTFALPIEQFDILSEQQQHLEQPVLEHQDSFNENWNGLVDYLNLTIHSDNNNSNTLLQLNDELSNPMGTMPCDIGLEQDVDLLQKDYLIQNATLPSLGMDISTDLNALSPIEELDSSVSFQSTNNSMMDFDFNDLSFLNTTLQNESNVPFDIDEVNNLLGSIQGTSNEILEGKALNLAENMDAIQMLEGGLTTPSASNGNASPFYDFGEPFDALEGATGGSDYSSNYGDMSDHFTKVSHLSESSNDSGFVNQGAFSSSPSSTPSYAGSPAGSHNGINSSTSSNDTEHDPHGTHTVAKHQVAHNHTYNTPPGQVPREVKKYAQKEPSRKGPHSRDMRRAEELKIPFTIDDIIDSPVETFNEMLAKHKLSEAQLTLVRDIRRRGKNKVAAQNCRKRKVGVIFSLNDEMVDLQKMRDRLVAERAAMDRERRKMKEKFGHLYTHIFQSLRDERGEPYDPSLYSLQQSSDGDVFLVPRNLTISKNSHSSATSSDDSAGSKKRKSFDP